MGVNQRILIRKKMTLMFFKSSWNQQEAILLGVKLIEVPCVTCPKAAKVGISILY